MRVSARRHSESTPQDLPERQDNERLKDMVGPGRRFPFGLPRTVYAELREGLKTTVSRANLIQFNRVSVIDRPDYCG